MSNQPKPDPWADDDAAFAHNATDHLDCWQCGGDGYVYSCLEDYACADPESGCDLCEQRCDICNRGTGE